MEVATAAATVITLVTACGVGSDAKRLSRSLRRVLMHTHLIDKDIHSKALHFHTFGNAITLACDSLREMQNHQNQSEILQKLTNPTILRDLDESCGLVQERLRSERDRIDRLGQGFGLFGKKMRIWDNIKWEFSLKDAIMSLEPEVNGIQVTLGLFVHIATLELQKLCMSDPRISLEEYERLKIENQRLARQLQDQESTVRLLSRQNLMIFSALGGSESGDGAAALPSHFTIEGLIRLSETVRKRPIAPRPVAVPGTGGHSQTPRSGGREVKSHHQSSPPHISSPVTGSSTATPLTQSETARMIIKLGPASAERLATMELSGDSAARTARVSCTACVDKTIDDNFVSLNKATAAGWSLKNLESNDPTTVQYSDGRRVRILGKCTVTDWIEKDKPSSLRLHFYVCEDMRPDLRLGRKWAQHRDATRKPR